MQPSPTPLLRWVGLLLLLLILQSVPAHAPAIATEAGGARSNGHAQSQTHQDPSLLDRLIGTGYDWSED